MDRRSFLEMVGTSATLATLGCAAAQSVRAETSAPTPDSAPEQTGSDHRGATIVVLGGGFGGITTALDVRAGLGAEHRVTIVDQRATFMMGLRKQWLLTGDGRREDGERPLEALRAKGIDVVHAAVTAIEPQHRRVRTDGGELSFDHLVIALGASPDEGLIPGFSPAVFDLYEVDDVVRASTPIAEIRRGRVVVGVFGLPFKCPPAPYETAMLLDDLFRRRGVRADIELRVFTPQPMTLPAAGQTASDALGALLAARKIQVELGRRPLRIEGTRTLFHDGAIDADVLLVVPPHRPPAVVRDSGLAMAGDWLKVDASTLATSQPGVWAIGDVTQIEMANGAPFPKAGVFAEAQGRVVAANIVARVLGRPPSATFDGKGHCFVETGNHEAFAVEGDFLAQPAPTASTGAPSADGYARKLAFEQERLKRWF